MRLNLMSKLQQQLVKSGWKKHPRVIAICAGNTCRSPLAEATLRTSYTLPHVESAGLQVSGPARAAKHTFDLAHQLYGYDLSTHRSRSLTTVRNWLDFDRFIVMTPQLAGDLIKRFGVEPEKVVILDVPDPYGQDKGAYVNTALRIEEELAKHPWLERFRHREVGDALTFLMNSATEQFDFV